MSEKVRGNWALQILHVAQRKWLFQKRMRTFPNLFLESGKPYNCFWTKGVPKEVILLQEDLRGRSLCLKPAEPSWNGYPAKTLECFHLQLSTFKGYCITVNSCNTKFGFHEEKNHYMRSSTVWICACIPKGKLHFILEIPDISKAYLLVI